jgi:glycosyltransferase involved in cell wall biosynthesis
MLTGRQVLLARVELCFAQGELGESLLKLVGARRGRDGGSLAHRRRSERVEHGERLVVPRRQRLRLVGLDHDGADDIYTAQGQTNRRGWVARNDESGVDRGERRVRPRSDDEDVLVAAPELLDPGRRVSQVAIEGNDGCGGSLRLEPAGEGDDGRGHRLVACRHDGEHAERPRERDCLKPRCDLRPGRRRVAVLRLRDPTEYGRRSCPTVTSGVPSHRREDTRLPLPRLRLAFVTVPHPMRPRVRLLLLITLAEVGGAQTYVRLLLPALCEQFDVTVAAWGPGPLREVAEGAGARYVALQHVRRPLSPWRDALGLLELYRLCRLVRPEIVHANSSKAGALGRLAAALARVPIRMFTVHGWAFEAYPGLTGTVYRWADRLMRRLTTATICVAENERQRGLRARTCDRRRTWVIHNAVDVAAAPAADPSAEPVTVVSVGRFAYPKDFATLIRALALLAPGSFRAAIAGDGPDRAELERELHGLGLTETVDMLGEVGDVPALLARSSVFVLSTRSEGLPISVIEAMAAGLPVVASSVGGIPELVVEGETGFLVPAGNDAALARALEPLLRDPELRRRLGAAARARAFDRFDLGRFRQAHTDLYRTQLELMRGARANGIQPVGA